MMTMTPRMLDIMRQTRVWVLILSILGFIGIGLQLIVLLLGRTGAIEILISLLFTAVYAAMMVFLFLYGQRIGQFLRVGDSVSLAEALRMQRIYWTIAGILAAMLLTFVVLGVIFGVGVAFLRFR